MTRYQRLFDPPSQDDLDYLPDPLGRLGMGSYVERAESSEPDPGWEGLRSDWMEGAPLERIFGDGVFDLRAGVGTQQPNRRGDVFKLQALLHREGFLDAAATEGPTGFWGGRDEYALRKFQKENGLTIDGFALPDGETMQTIAGFYRPRRRQPRPDGSYTREKRPEDPVAQLRPIGLGRDDGSVAPTLRGSAAGEADSAPVSEERPVLYRWQDRQRSILDDTPGKIKLEDNPKADSSDPWYLSNGAGLSAVQLHDEIIRKEAARQKVDADLIRAIIYAENARGHYFGAARAAEGLGKADSIFPMNINPEIWRDLGFADRQASDPATNIEIGAKLIGRIRDRLENPTAEAVGTLYNSLPKDRVTDYGAYIGRLMREKPWAK